MRSNIWTFGQFLYSIFMTFVLYLYVKNINRADGNKLA